MLSNREILTRLLDNDPDVWENIYDKFSSVIFEVISNLTTDPRLKKDIFTEVFRDIKQSGILLEASSANMSFTISRYVYRYTVTKLGLREPDPMTDGNGKPGIVNLLSTRCDSIRDAAFILNITEEEAKRQLHLEWKEQLALLQQEETPVKQTARQIFQNKKRRFFFFLRMFQSVLHSFRSI